MRVKGPTGAAAPEDAPEHPSMPRNKAVPAAFSC
jgi:hypothetical protein